MTTTHNSPQGRAQALANAPHAELDVTILLPCRNEERTVGLCIEAALAWLATRKINGEVLVVNNASTDASASVARSAGARVVTETRVGYGNALRTGIRAARGNVVIMADADNTYDLAKLDAFYDPIAVSHTHELVIGNRFASTPHPAAMNWLHRAGNGALSALARAVAGSDIRDFHCGLRSFSRSTMADLPAWSTGMEYATHMLTHASRRALRIAQTPVALRPPAENRHSHLRPARDGLRHIAAILRDRAARVPSQPT